VLKNFVTEGYDFEKNMSFIVHSANTPVLLSSLLLNDLQLCQIDISDLRKASNSNCITLFECKRKYFPSKSQYKRLTATADYLSRILDMEVKIKVIFAKSNKLNYS
jgi:hypothetical protein